MLDEAPARRRAAWASAVAIGLVLWPIQENWAVAPADGYPLSPYPMFAKRRDETVGASYLVAFDARGDRWLLPFNLVSSGGFNMVRKNIGRMIRLGRADDLCRTLAENVANDATPRMGTVARVGVASGRFRYDDYLAGTIEPVSEKVHATCQVPRPAKVEKR